MIAIYGVPGSGKTSLSRILGIKYNLPVIEADRLRKDAQVGKTPENDPFFFFPTTEAYKAIGERTKKNVIRGLREVRNAYRVIIDREIESRNGKIIIESAFLDPVHLKEKGRINLLVVSSEKLHRERFLVHRTEDAFTNGQFKNARILQEFLIAEAKELGISTFENSGDLNELILNFD